MKSHRRVKGRAAVVVKRRVGHPKVKKVVIDRDVALHVEAPAGHVPVVIPGPAPHVMRVVPVPVEKAKEPGFWASLFGVEQK